MTTTYWNAALVSMIAACIVGCATPESTDPGGDARADASMATNAGSPTAGLPGANETPRTDAVSGAGEVGEVALPAAADEPATTLPDWRKMWDFGDPAATEARFRAAIAEGQQARDDSYVLTVMTQLARAQGLQRNWDLANRTLDEVKSHLPGKPAEVLLRYLLERGRTLNSSGRPASAALLFEDAWDVGEGAGLDPLRADAGHMLAIVLPPAAALEWSEKTMELCETSPDPRCRSWLGPLYNNTGWTYHDRGDFDKALELWEKSLTFREEEGAEEPIFIARWTIARCYRSMGRFQDALALQHQLHEDRAAASNPGKGYVEEEIGECLLALERPDDARPWFAQAYERLNTSEWFREEEPARLARIKELGGM